MSATTGRPPGVLADNERSARQMYTSSRARSSVVPRSANRRLSSQIR
jgi:hypothetical protein